MTITAPAAHTTAALHDPATQADCAPVLAGGAGGVRARAAGMGWAGGCIPLGREGGRWPLRDLAPSSKLVAIARAMQQLCGQEVPVLFWGGCWAQAVRWLWF